MKASKKIRKFLRKQGRLRWYKKFLRESAFPFGIIGDDPISLISMSNNPFNLIGSGYEQAILDNLRLKWISYDDYINFLNMRLTTEEIACIDYKQSERAVFNNTPNDSISKFNNECKIKTLGIDIAGSGCDKTVITKVKATCKDCYQIVSLEEVD